MARLVRKILDAIQPDDPPGQQTLEDPGLLLALRLQLVGTRHHAGCVPVADGRACGIAAQRADQEGPVRPGDRTGRLEPMLNARVDALRPGLEQVAREVGHALLDLELPLELQATLVPLRDVAAHDGEACLAGGRREGAQRRLEPAPGAVAVPDPEGERRGVAVGGGRRRDLLRQRNAIVRMDEQPGVHVLELAGRVPAEILDVRTDEEHAAVRGKLADRVLRLLGQRAEALLGGPALLFRVQPTHRAAQDIGHQRQARDLLSRPAPLLAHAEEAEETHRTSRPVRSEARDRSGRLGAREPSRSAAASAGRSATRGTWISSPARSFAADQRYVSGAALRSLPVAVGHARGVPLVVVADVAGGGVRRVELHALRSGEPPRRLEPVPQAGCEIAGLEAEEAARDVGDALLPLELLLEGAIGENAAGDVPADENGVQLTAAGVVGPTHQLHPAPGVVAVAEAEDELRGGLLAEGEGADRVHFGAVLRVYELERVDPEHLLGPVAEGLREARAHVEKPRVPADLDDRVPGVLRQGAEVLVALLRAFADGDDLRGGRRIGHLDPLVRLRLLGLAVSRVTHGLLRGIVEPRARA